MKLSVYAAQTGISYRTAWRWYKAGKLDRAVIYARVSAAENKDNLEGQAKRLRDYCAAKGYQVVAEVKEIGSGINDCRPKLMKLLATPTFTPIVVEHKDRLTRFGFNYIALLLEQQNRRIEVVNWVEDGKEDIVQDFVSIITSFCARIYGQRRSKRKTERIIAELTGAASDKKAGDPCG
jgi:predicted site-specific integrase-resolvase